MNADRDYCELQTPLNMCLEGVWLEVTTHESTELPVKANMQEQSGTVRIVLADDHSIFREALRMLLTAEPPFEVIGEAGDGAEAVRLARTLRPDVLLMDLAMPGYSGMQALRDLARSPEPVRVIVLAAVIDKTQTVELLQLGARALILKDSATRELIQSIHTVMAGHYWVGHESFTGLLEAVRDLGISNEADNPTKDFGLTPRELEIIAMVSAARRNRDIAEKLSISEETVKSHITHIFNKLGVSNRLELVLFAMHHRLVSGS